MGLSAHAPKVAHALSSGARRETALNAVRRCARPWSALKTAIGYSKSMQDSKIMRVVLFPLLPLIPLGFGVADLAELHLAAGGILTAIGVAWLRGALIVRKHPGPVTRKLQALLP